MGREGRKAEIADPVQEAFAPGCPIYVPVPLEERARSLHPTGMWMQRILLPGGAKSRRDGEKSSS